MKPNTRWGEGLLLNEGTALLIIANGLRLLRPEHRVLVPTVFGVGWTVNLGHLLKRIFGALIPA